MQGTIDRLVAAARRGAIEQIHTENCGGTWATPCTPANCLFERSLLAIKESAMQNTISDVPIVRQRRFRCTKGHDRPAGDIGLGDGPVTWFCALCLRDKLIELGVSTLEEIKPDA